MLSYQHIYHAGNKADIHKHLWLMAVLGYLTQKDKPFCWIDTHAGRGVYDLSAPEAQKLGEYKDGYQEFAARFPQGQDVPLLIHAYLDLVSGFNQRNAPLHYYPGSAMIAAKLLRPIDRLEAFERHKGEFPHLQNSLTAHDNARAHFADGYEGLKSLLPPQERRGGILIDPSFEIKTEYEDCAHAVLAAHKKWTQGVYMIWYPILKAGNHKILTNFLEDGIARKEPDDLVIDEWIFQDNTLQAKGLLGSGMAIINAPYGCAATLDEIKGMLRQKSSQQ